MRSMRKRKHKQLSGHSELVLQAAKVVQELQVKSTCAAMKLTQDAFLRNALRIARSTSERLVQLEASIKQDSLFETADALRRMCAAVRTPNWTAPPQELRRLNYLITPGVVSELAMAGSSTFELFALAAKITAERYPEAFGSCEDTAAHDKRLLELTLERDELFAKIENSYTADDLSIDSPDERGFARVTFKISGGSVPIGLNAGERLVGWMLASKSNS